MLSEARYIVAGCGHVSLEPVDPVVHLFHAGGDAARGSELVIMASRNAACSARIRSSKRVDQVIGFGAYRRRIGPVLHT